MPNARTALTIRPVFQTASRFSEMLFQPPRDTIRGLDQNSWYSPLQPVQPFAPSSTEPRQFQYYAGQNLIWTPRFDAEYTAADLKVIAMYPLARVCIEIAKDMLCKAPWEIQARPKPGETKKQAAKRSEKDETLLALNRFFEYPDREHSWPEWLRPLLDDLFVIDAPATMIRRTFKGEIVELMNVAGETIARYIDQNGMTPMPPSPAYCQNWWGMPLVDLTADQVIYKPRNIVRRNTLSSQIYGCSPIEQLAPEIQIGMKRLEFVMDYYNEGSVPGMMHVVPAGVTPGKIEEAMLTVNSRLSGNLAERSKYQIIQGFQQDGHADQFLFPKEPLLADQIFDEQLTRKIAFGIGISPQRLIRALNRAAAEQMDDAADIAGMMPWIEWIKGYIDYIIQKKFGYINYEIAFDPYAEPDPAKQATTIVTLWENAQITANEGRQRLGEEPVSNPMADQLGTRTGTGFVPLGQAAAQAGAQIDERGNVTVSQPQAQPQKGPGESAQAAEEHTAGGVPRPQPRAARARPAREQQAAAEEANKAAADGLVKKKDGTIEPGVNAHWVTINGVHVLINERTGIVERGPKHLVGKDELDRALYGDQRMIATESVEKAAVAPVEGVNGRWVTINHVHVFVKDGVIIQGPEHLIGKRPEESSSHELKLSDGKMDSSEDLGGGSGETYLVHFEDGSTGVFKLEGGADPDAGRSNIEDGYQVERETGAWQVAKVVGMDDMVTPAVATHLKVGDYNQPEYGTLSEFQHGDVAASVSIPKRYDGHRDLTRAAAFDFVIGNEDRNAGNWLYDADNRGKLRLIDHALSFPETSELKAGNYQLISHAAKLERDGEDLLTPAELAEPYVRTRRAIRSTLADVGLPQASIDGVSKRISRMAKHQSWLKLWREETGGQR